MLDGAALWAHRVVSVRLTHLLGETLDSACQGSAVLDRTRETKVDRPSSRLGLTTYITFQVPREGKRFAGHTRFGVIGSWVVLDRGD